MIKRKFVFAHMGAAWIYAGLSSSKRLQVGAVLVKNNTPIAIGYNGTKPGHDNCCEDENGNTKPGVRHAEINALNKLWTSQNTADGAMLFVTHSPCPDCLDDLIHAGVKDIFYEVEYRIPDGIRVAIERGVNVWKVTTLSQKIERVNNMYSYGKVIATPHGIGLGPKKVENFTYAEALDNEIFSYGS